MRWVSGLGKDAQDCPGPVLSRCMHAARDIAALCERKSLFAEISNFSFSIAGDIQERDTPSKRVLIVFGRGFENSKNCFCISSSIEEAQISRMGRPKKDSKQITIHFPVDRTALARKRRPGQKAPTARHGPKLSSQNQTAGSAPAGSRRSGLSWRETLERRDAAWEVRRPASERRFLASYLQVGEWERMKHALILNHIQDRVREALSRTLESHQCSQDASECQWEPLEDLKVAFIDLETRDFLNIPSCRCKICGEVASVEPEDIGCFPATPSQPVTWFGYGLLRAISFTKKTKGISIQGKEFLSLKWTGGLVLQ
jgi:hypothetical protein